MNALSEAAKFALQGIQESSGADATDVTFVTGRGTTATQTTTPCILWPETNAESRARGSQAGGVTNRWQCVFTEPSQGIPSAEARCSYQNQSFRVLRVTNYYNELYIGDLVATT